MFKRLNIHNRGVPAYSGIFPGGAYIFFFPGGAQHPLGPENPLKSIDFTSQEGGLAPIAPPQYASDS